MSHLTSVMTCARTQLACAVSRYAAYDPKTDGIAWAYWGVDSDEVLGLCSGNICVPA